MCEIVSVENAPVIFPKYTAMLMEKGVSVDIVGQRETDSKLTSMVYTAILSDTVSELPDIAKYNVKTKTWESFYIDENQKVTLENKSGVLVEYVNYVSEWTDKILFVIRNFIAQFSGATIKF